MENPFVLFFSWEVDTLAALKWVVGVFFFFSV